ncbi:MAG: nuclear transport factor 2 family protein [Caldilineaceae bacterium]
MSDQANAIATIIQAEAALAAAHLTLDLATFDRLLHPDYVIIQPGGARETKAETLASLATGNRRWELAASDELNVQLYGNSALVTGQWRGKGRNGTEHFDYRARFLSVWVREDGAWRNVAYMATAVE